jgi:iron(III) transport system ATP-binding protein
LQCLWLRYVLFCIHGFVNMAELLLRNIVKRYGTKVVLDDISLHFASGSYVALLGPSGSGKSTLLRAIAGLAEIDRGEIWLGGKSLVGRPPEQRDLGMVFQSYAVWPHMSVRENVAYPLMLRRERNATLLADEALARVGLGGFGDRVPGTLSGGQQQRVALARALCMKPAALLLDEPLANLDPHLRADLCDQFRQICKEQALTFIHVTHDREEALGLCSELVVLKDGRVVQHGPPEVLFHSPKDVFVAEFVAEGVALPGALLGREGRVVVPRHGLRFDAKGALRATVRGVAYAGSGWTLTVEFPGPVTARVRVPLDTQRPSVGELVPLSADVVWTF